MLLTAPPRGPGFGYCLDQPTSNLFIIDQLSTWITRSEQISCAAIIWQKIKIITSFVVPNGNFTQGDIKTEEGDKQELVNKSGSLLSSLLLQFFLDSLLILFQGQRSPISFRILSPSLFFVFIKNTLDNLALAISDYWGFFLNRLQLLRTSSPVLIIYVAFAVASGRSFPLKIDDVVHRSRTKVQFLFRGFLTVLHEVQNILLRRVLDGVVDIIAFAFELERTAKLLHFLQEGALESFGIEQFLLLGEGRCTQSLYSSPYWLSRACSWSEWMGDSSSSCSMAYYGRVVQSEYLQIEMNHSVSTMSGKTKLKVIFLGNQCVGKTCIIDKYINDRFEETANPTVGIDFLAKNVSHNAKNYRLQLWDTAGQQRFRSLIPGYLKDAHCALIVYDVTSKASFADIEGWIKLYNENRVGEGFIFLIGNKIDREFREVTQEEGLDKANRLGLPYFQISAKTGEHVDDLFVAIIEQQTDKKIASSSFLPLRPSMKPVQVVREEREEKEEEEAKPNVEDTGAKINEEQALPAENIVLKNEKKPETKPKKAECC